MNQMINVIGGGLAGVEAAWQAANSGAHVKLYEMRPILQTPAHRTDKLAEIVCSNSLKTDEPGTAPYLLKEELRRGGSLVMDAAAATRVPAGAALSVDRIKFAEMITERIENHPNVEIVREEGGLEYARRRGEEFAQEAEEALAEVPESVYRSSLGEAIGYVMDRRS